MSTGERIRLPVRTETIVVPDTSEFSFHTRFESNMTEVSLQCALADIETT